MCAESQYCAYRHFASDLEIGGQDRLIAMYTAYFDDSGTDNNSSIAIAACYVSTKRGWDTFVKEWDDARCEEGFDKFHMAEFVAPREQGKEPFCSWDNTKKAHVYKRLDKIINDNKRIGIACAVPKDAYDGVVPERMRQYFGREHYTFAVRMCMMRIMAWREKSQISLPVQYVFDWEMQAARKRKEISAIFEAAHPDVGSILGIEPEGYGFQRATRFKPLQAADILAWQMRCHMDKIFPMGADAPELCHEGFRLLREDQEMDLGFFTEKQLRYFTAANEKSEQLNGPLPILFP